MLVSSHPHLRIIYDYTVKLIKFVEWKYVILRTAWDDSFTMTYSYRSKHWSSEVLTDKLLDLNPALADVISSEYIFKKCINLRAENVAQLVDCLVNIQDALN